MWWLLRSDLQSYQVISLKILGGYSSLKCLLNNEHVCLYVCVNLQVYVCRWKRPIALLGWHIPQDCRRASFRRSRPLQTISPFLLPETHTTVLQYPIALHKHTHTHTSCSGTLSSGNIAVAHGHLTALVKTTCAVHAAKMLVLVHQATK